MENYLLRKLSSCIFDPEGKSQYLLVEFETLHYPAKPAYGLLAKVTGDIKLDYTLNKKVRRSPYPIHNEFSIPSSINWRRTGYVQTTTVVVKDLGYTESDAVSKTERDVIKPGGTG